MIESGMNTQSSLVDVLGIASCKSCITYQIFTSFVSTSFISKITDLISLHVFSLSFFAEPVTAVRYLDFHEQNSTVAYCGEDITCLLNLSE
jgi:hypothetical protein